MVRRLRLSDYLWLLIVMKSNGGDSGSTRVRLPTSVRLTAMKCEWGVQTADRYLPTEPRYRRTI